VAETSVERRPAGRGRRALLVETDQEYVSLATRLLTRDGWEVEHTNDPHAALDRVRDPDSDFAVALVSAALTANGDGSLLERIRADSPSPLIALSTPEDGDTTVRQVIDSADYDLVKPFSPRRFRAALRAVVSRGRVPARAGQIPAELRVGDLAISSGRLEASVRGRTVELSPREFSLLHVLLASAGTVFTRDELARTAWGWRGASPESRAIDNAIRRLRQKIEADPKSPTYILTDRGSGYRLDPN
jgi:DNA-binding response OmpR family regulator